MPNFALRYTLKAALFGKNKPEIAKNKEIVEEKTNNWAILGENSVHLSYSKMKRVHVLN